MNKSTFLQWLKMRLEDQTATGRFARDIERLPGRPRGATGMHAWLNFVNGSYHSETMTSSFAEAWKLYRLEFPE